MPLIALVARTAFTFHGRAMAEGERFEASALDTVLLQAARKAAFAPAQSTPLPAIPGHSKRVYRRRDLQAESSTQLQADPE